MDSSLTPSHNDDMASEGKESMVDPFLVEALENSRHRLTILRMELDIQRFLNSSDQQQFEFQHFPSSYLRLAAHRVAHHYGLQTMVQDNVLDGMGNRIIVRRTMESRFPAVCLSEIPAKQSENDKSAQMKIAIKTRPSKGFANGANEFGIKRSPVRTVEERKELYDRARARIFSGNSSPESDDNLTRVPPTEEKKICLIPDENEGCRNYTSDSENSSMRDGFTSSRVAIFRDREKDRTDPDYDRSYERYVRNHPMNQNFNLVPFNVPKVQVPFVQYDAGFSQLGQMPRTRASVSYRPPSTSVMNPFCALGLNQTSRDAVYTQWASPAMMYAHSYDQFRHTVFQAPFCQQPLSFDYSQNH